MQDETNPRARLDAVLAGLAGPLAVAVSGGIDSLTLAAVAQRQAGDRTIMVHAVSPAVPGDATARVERVGQAQGWALHVINAGEFDDADYRANPVNRCFFCKTNLYGAIARRTSAQIVSGANLDDLGDYRPGLDAARDKSVRHPYIEARIDKATVRRLARDVGLGDFAELPAAPCLSSRIETGIPIRADLLSAIHAVERQIAADFPRGTVRCRVRASGVVVELDPATLDALGGGRAAAVRAAAESLFAGTGAAGGVSFASYRRGSAFLHEPA